MLINIYDDDQSELILDEGTYNPTAIQNFHNLGEKTAWNESLATRQRYQNSSFIQMHVFDESDNFIITLNSGKPLLRQPSTGKYYFGDYHYHSGTYMVGKKHTNILKNIPNHNVIKDTKYKIQYAVFGDMLLEFATYLAVQNTFDDDQETQTENQQEGGN